jgi:hypothetical protein
MQTLKQFLELFVLVVQIISFPLVAWSIFVARKEAKASRDLQIALTLSQSFRERWEGGWSDVMYEIRHELKPNNENVPRKYQDHLYKMINWIDWLGVLIQTKSLSEQEIIFRSIRPQLKEIIQYSRPLIREDIKREGRDHWGALLTVADALGVEIEVTGNGGDEEPRGIATES